MTHAISKPRIISHAHAKGRFPVVAQTHLQQPAHQTRSISTETRPCFASSWIEQPADGRDEPVSRYSVAGVNVTIGSPKGTSLGTYTVDPPEYRLTPARVQALAEAISEISELTPDESEVSSLATIRPYIKSKAKDRLYPKLASRSHDPSCDRRLEAEVDDLAEVLCKYTAGYGVLETLLEDGSVQDIYLDAPSSQTPVQVVLRSDTGPGVRQKCRTNIFVGRKDLAAFVSRVKFETGLPFSEANPVLEADIKRLRARVTLVGPPLSEKGVSVAIRKHSEDMWTMPALISNGTLSPLLASFLWACVLGRRTVLVAGSRGAGKTTLLGSMLLEFPLSQRILLIEDTPEIPVPRLQELGYDVQGLRFRPEAGESGPSAEDTLRVSLRMGESAIVIGEVRGSEARVLYESMRAGSAGSSVLGTIHGNSARGVLDRAVEDLGVSERAFSSTDIVAVVGLVRAPDGTRFSRRVVEVCEVRAEEGRVTLVPLFDTQPGCACAKPTVAFAASCRSVTGIGEALGCPPEKIMDIIKARAHADQVSAEVDRATGFDDGSRVKSNEILTKCLFGQAGPEAGLKEWKLWRDAQASR